jgi:hypothetical protein
VSDDQILLDPTAGRSPIQRPRRARVPSIDGLTIGLLDISKRRGDIFLDRLERLLRDRGLAVRRYRKPRFSALAPVEVKQQIHAECDVVIEALAD